ncbi:MAG TPA: hypothetical protein VMZ50_04820 [Phycisphaerae bacterium]|nr:hypothetical protein [Phycisphaerae bacterium]
MKAKTPGGFRGLRVWVGVMGAVLWGIAAGPAAAVETPPSSGEASQVIHPLFRIPRIGKPPQIDGQMAEGEWTDASALSAFWYWDFPGGHYDYMAPFETQLQVYAAYDRENLYVAFTSPVYPEGSWLRALGRFTDVIEHPLYGIYRDDYVGLGVWPYHDLVKSYRMGQFLWFINCISMVGDAGPKTGRKWQSGVKTRGVVTRTRWVQEMSIPLANMVHGPYAGKEDAGRDIVKLPPADGTTYIFRLDRCDGEWGIRGFHNKFSDTPSRMILDSDCVSFQVNELGPIMEDILDVRLTAKNHSKRSQTVRLGFFVESAEGLIYSSYDDKQLKDGLLELVPGEVRRLRLRKPLPGITVNGNIVWFDVRSAGSPAKSIFRTRLVYFHSQDRPRFKEWHIAGIAMNRPPRRDFDFRFDYSYHTNRASAVVDTGIHGASDAARTAVEAKFVVLDSAAEDKEIAAKPVAFQGPFACAVIDLPPLAEGREYKCTVLLLDRNKRIVGEETASFLNKTEEWMNNPIGTEDVVWEPFVPIREHGDGLETLKHRFTLDATGLPRQIYIKHDVRDLPLERRGPDVKRTDAELIALGRGPQLRTPMRLIATVGGKEVAAKAVSPAKLRRRGKSEFEYASKLKIGPVDADLRVQYDCDGAMTVKLTYGSDSPAVIDALEMVADVAGPMDMTPGQGVKGVVWDSANTDPELYYSHFVPWLRFGSNERAFSWICRTERGWILDRDGSAMTLARDGAGEITWRVKFVNHKADVQGRRTIEFTVLTHPSKPRPADCRRIAWLYRGDIWAREYMMRVVLDDEWLKGASEKRLKEDPRFPPYKDWVDYLRRDAHVATRSPRGTPYEEMAAKRLTDPPWNRYGLCRNVGVYHLLDAARVFGAGKARPTGIEVFHDHDFGRVPDDSDWRKEKISNWYWTYGDKGLKDLEDGGFVKDSSSKGQVAEIYGPIHVPPHDFRVVWGYGLPETSSRKRNP